jgi:DNA-binding response OmpR family regulator
MSPHSADLQSRADPSAPGALAGRCILVVEDEYYLADDIVRELKSRGARILGPAGELGQAERLVDDHLALDAAVIDVNLQDEMVYPLARKLRARGIPFLFTTGYDKQSIAAEFRDVRLLEKPLDIAEFLRELDALFKPGAPAR